MPETTQANEEPPRPDETTESPALPGSHFADPPKTSSRKRFSRLRILLALVNVSLLVGVLALAYVLDAREHEGRVVRNVNLAGVDISGMSIEEVRSVVDRLAEEYRTSSFVVDGGDSTFSIPTRGIEMQLLEAPTVDGAVSLRRTGNTLEDVLGWARSFVSPTTADVEVDYDEGLLAEAIRRGDQGARLDPVEPTFEIEDGRLNGVEGVEGRGLDPKDAIEAIDDVVSEGAPLRMGLERKTLEPRFAERDADDLAEVLEAQVLTPLPMQAGSKTKTLDAEMIRPWLGTRAGVTNLEMTIDASAATLEIEKLFADAGVAPKEPAWNVVANRPQVAPGQPGNVCCEQGAAELIESALRARIAGPAAQATITLPLRQVQPKTTADEIPRLGIQEPIGSFTTYFQSGEARNINIKRISDLVRGSVIEPGETFSLNKTVGPRTTQKGFVEGGVIQNGEFAESVGGGISQFATTLFNASFFGGLDFGEYQAHTIYIARYPFGREATISYPHPDLEIRNTTPHGVLIWPAYTDNSVTVTLYSTRYATGEQTAQTTAPRGACTRVTTERTRTYVDGRRSVDSVNATYQPEEGKKC